MKSLNEQDEQNLRDGTITGVKMQKRDGERVSVFIDEEFAFGLMLDIAVREGLRKGISLTIADQERLLAQEEIARAKRSLLDLVTHRPRTATEVRRALLRKGFDSENVDIAVEWGEDQKYLDDVSYAEQFVRIRSGRKGHGPRRLKADLTRKGIPARIAEAIILENVDTDTIFENAERLAQARWARLQREPDLQKRRKKLSDYLIRQGYDYETVRTILGILQENE